MSSKILQIDKTLFHSKVLPTESIYIHGLIERNVEVVERGGNNMAFYALNDR